MRAAGVYVAAAFVVLQLGEIVLPAFNMPDWTLQSLVVCAFLGLPVVLASAWTYDLTSKGLKRTPGSGRIGQESRAPSVALLAVSAASVTLASLWFNRSVVRAETGAAGGAGPTLSSAPATGVSPFLPFVNLDPDAPVTAIAVLPLADFAEGDDFFAPQLHDEIITQLSRMTSLRVVPRASVERYADTQMLLPRIAEELRVQAVVTGSVARTPESDTVRISIQLLHAPSDTHMLTRTFQREMKDILRLQTEVAREIARAVQGEVEGEAANEDVVQVATVDPEAHRAVLRGWEAFERGTSDGLQVATGHFSRAVENDSTYAAAWVGLAGARLATGLAGTLLTAEMLARVQEEIQRAAELGGAEEEVRAAQVAFVDYLAGLSEDLATDTQSILLALDFGPESESDSLSRRYVRDFTRIGRWAASFMGRGEGSGREGPHLLEARRAMDAAQYDSAIRVFRAILQRDSTRSPVWSGLEHAQVMRGDYAAAVDVRANRILATDGDTPESRQEVQELRDAFDRENPRTYWEWRQQHNADLTARRRHVPHLEHAVTALGLGHHDEALAHLESAIDAREPELVTLKNSPIWDLLRDDPRFRQMARRVRELWRGPGRGR